MPGQDEVLCNGDLKKRIALAVRQRYILYLNLKNQYWYSKSTARCTKNKYTVRNNPFHTSFIHSPLSTPPHQHPKYSSPRPSSTASASPSTDTSSHPPHHRSTPHPHHPRMPRQTLGDRCGSGMRCGRIRRLRRLLRRGSRLCSGFPL